MDVKSVMDARRFTPEKLAKVSLFESERMFCDVYGVSPGQEQKPHSHDGSDKVYYVVEGCGHFKIDGELRSVGEKNVVYVPSGIEHSVRNEGTTNLTLLVWMAPHPNYVSRKL
ncbi:MAG TPA: cupin domain-containing protein [Planctomycetota bacterium]|nr:cupin domain-containing protein [Planctomycetota bacterium]